ncbi:hypothetical protein UFOVP357_3 [uncultured Caudovirales phage]|uniref:Uncharacterized protein n=1 Tax=uncultured Caudovirales phage TaxID=2100421 RepID=A0A6J7WV85_9CAUD|nr:hypothetical protein UFOVP357_3 [uncultured Caudovirales phage]
MTPMAFLRPVDLNEVKRYTHESGDWLDLRQNLSKREVNAILKVMPSAGFETAESAQMISTVEGIVETLFNNILVGWSVDDAPSLETYYTLSAEAAQWVDNTLFEHFNAQSLNKAEEGKPLTSLKGQPKVTLVQE